MYQFSSTLPLDYRQGAIFLGLNEKNKEVGISTDRHAITIAGSRSGKGAGLIIPNLLRWPHNALVIDPKGENAENTYEKREAMGQAVHVLDPFTSADIPDRIRARFNPLTSIDLESNRARVMISAIANGLIVVHDAKHLEWTTGARALLSGIIAYVIAEAPPEHRTFAAVRAILMQPTEIEVEEGEEPQGLYADAQSMAQDNRVGGLIRSAGVAIMTAIESEKSMEKDFLGLARRSTEWLDDEHIAACLNDSTFSLDELKSGDASIYLVLPADSDFLSTYGAFLRLFVKASLTSMGVGQTGKKCLFILDEFYSLGKLEEISEASGRMPSFGVHLWPFLQNLGQLRSLYGREGSETFFANADIHIFFGNSDGETLDYISDRIGKFLPNEVVENPPTKRAYDNWTDGQIFKTEQEAREILTIDQENEQLKYQHKMGLVGTPRLPPDQVKNLVAKSDRAPVANSIIVFGKGSNIFNLKLSPYFITPPSPQVTKKQQQNPTSTLDFLDREVFIVLAVITFGMLALRKWVAEMIVNMGGDIKVMENVYLVTPITLLGAAILTFLLAFMSLELIAPHISEKHKEDISTYAVIMFSVSFFIARFFGLPL